MSPLLSDLEPMSISEWQAERQKFLDSLDPMTKFHNEVYKKLVSDNDAYYYGLAEQIKLRQEEAMPIPGEGFFQSFEYLGKSLIVVGRLTGVPIVSVLGKGTLQLGDYLQSNFL